MELSEQLRQYSQRLQDLSDELSAGIHAVVRNDLAALAEKASAQEEACRRIKAVRTPEILLALSGQLNHRKNDSVNVAAELKASIIQTQGLQQKVRHLNQVYSSLLRKSRSYTNTLIAISQHLAQSSEYPGQPSTLAHSICEV